MKVTVTKMTVRDSSYINAQGQKRFWGELVVSVDPPGEDEEMPSFAETALAVNALATKLEGMEVSA